MVIVNHDGADDLWHCLFALKTQTYPVFEILLVDNHSTDSSLSFVRSNYPHVQILECQEDFGFAMGCNLGVKTAKGDLVAVVKSDAVPTPDWLFRLVRDFKEGWPEKGAWGSRILPKKPVEGAPLGQRLTLNFLGRPVPGFLTEERDVFYPEGSAFLWARFLVPEGPFDADYFSGQEDVYLGWRLRLMGCSIGQSASARVFREPGEAFDFPQWKKIYYDTRNRWLNLVIFYQRGNLARVFPWLLLDAACVLGRSLGVGFNPFLGNFLAVAWFGTHPSIVLRKRRETQQKRKIGDENILKCLSGRMAGDGGFFRRLLNFVSLAYCALVGLRVLESGRDE